MPIIVPKACVDSCPTVAWSSPRRAPIPRRATPCRILTGLSLLLTLAACASLPPDPLRLQPIDNSRLPVPDLQLGIEGLGPCTDQTDRTFELRRGQPLTILVHGCLASAGRFRTLAQVFAHQGQQTVCYSYDDRRSLVAVADELRRALDRLGKSAQPSKMTLIGHSQGGLIARRALRADPSDGTVQRNSRQQLITISAPFSGIAAADHCASPTARLLSLGLVVPICWAISGDKWYEITRASDFMRQPGGLHPTVERHLLISTDERHSCRTEEAGRCLEDDFVFSLEEQALPPAASDPRVEEQVLRVGHAAVVGDGRQVPHQLIDLLQEAGAMPTPPVAGQSDFRRFLARVYTRTQARAAEGQP